jgi:hypothetical protein
VADTPRPRVSWADAFSAVHAALDAGLVLHGRDVDERRDVTAGRERRAVGPDAWITWSYYEGGRQEREEYTSASDLARSLIGNAIVPGILGKVGAWSSAIAAIGAANIVSAPDKAIEKALTRVGWELCSIEIDAVARRARVDVKRDGMFVTLDSSDRETTITRQRQRRSVVTIGPHFNRTTVERLDMEFVGRSKHGTFAEGLTSLATYMVDNGNGRQLHASTIVRLLSMPAVLSADADRTEAESTHGPSTPT